MAGPFTNLSGSQNQDATPSSVTQIAIVGMAVNVPGAHDKDQLWQLLEQGLSTVSEIPEWRFKVSDYNNTTFPDGKRQMTTHTGNFLDGVAEFDNIFFSISPREAKSMDPQQRLLLHCAYEALENSGYVPHSSPTNDPDEFGCYIGAATHDYVHNLRDTIDVYYSTGTLSAFLSGRISHAMQLGGPSIVVDTACSSSTVAMYQGCRALMNGDCKAALVGGVNVISSPDMMLGLDKARFLSPTGQCKPFDSSADGYSRSEGCGIFVIKRLSDAIAENDQILGVIRGIEVNQSGLSQSITHPHAPTQERLFKRLLSNSGVDPRQVSLIEAHGTGTQAGDPTEMESILNVFGSRTVHRSHFHITSLKANIGHLEAASGAVSLAKLLLMMKHGTIPRQLSFHALNPRIPPLEASCAIIATERTPWTVNEGSPRIALLNNFGSAGSNAAMLVEELVPRAYSDYGKKLHLVFGLSAKTEDALINLKARYIDFLQSQACDGVEFHNIAYTMTSRRQLYQFRTAVQASSKAELTHRLSHSVITQVRRTRIQVVFVFSGQGSQYFGMGRSLYATAPLFKQIVDECNEFLVKSGFPGVLPIIHPDSSEIRFSKLEEIQASQIAVTVLEYALARLWSSWGVEPVAVVGHSLGEYAALLIANVLSLHDALFLVASRARLMVQKCTLDSTSMLATNLGPTDVVKALASSSLFASLAIACHNSDTDCVLSGPLHTLKEFQASLETEFRCKTRLLPVLFGYHSPAMQPLLQNFTILAQRAKFEPPRIPIISNLYGKVIHPGDENTFNASYLARHCVEPVRFTEGICDLFSERVVNEADVAWIEIGPHACMLPMLKAINTVPKNCLFLPSMHHRREPWDTLAASLTQLFTSSVVIKWREVFASQLPAMTCIDLPSYPFKRTKFWVDYKDPSISGIAPQTSASVTSTIERGLLGSWLQYPSPSNGYVAKFETPIDDLAHLIVGHRVAGLSLCPASLYLEQTLVAIEFARRHLGLSFHDAEPKFRAISFPSPLVHDETASRIIISTIKMNDDGTGDITVTSRTVPSRNEITHAHGDFSFQPKSQGTLKFRRRLPFIRRQMAALSSADSPPERLTSRTIYDFIFPRVVEYGKEYRVLQSLKVTQDLCEGHADIQLPRCSDSRNYKTRLLFLDALLHMAGFIANMRENGDFAYICSQIGAVRILSDQIGPDTSYVAYCSNAWLADEGIILAEVHALSTRGSSRIIAHIKGIQFKRVRLSAFKSSLSRTSENTPPAFNASVTPIFPALEFARSSPHSSHPSLSYVSTQVIQIVADACGVSPHNLDTSGSLYELGVNSLMTIEILNQLQAAFPMVTLSAQTISECHNISDLVGVVASPTGLDVSAPNTPPFRRGLPKQPLSTPSTPRTLVDDDSVRIRIDDIREVLASILETHSRDILDDSEFESLGLDSLASIEALHTLKAHLGLDLPYDFFITCRTLQAIHAYLDKNSLIHKASIVNSPISTPRRTLLSSTQIDALKLNDIPRCIQQSASSTQIPLFLIHDGSGLTNYYDRLPTLNRSLWCIPNPRFLSCQPWDSVVQMATAYADLISKATSGPVILGGWSFGGTVAYEVCRQLDNRNVPVQGLLLIDSPAPVNRVPLSGRLVDSVLDLGGRAVSPELGQLIKNQILLSSRLLEGYSPRITGEKGPPIALLRSSDGYNPPGIDVPAWLADRGDSQLDTVGWTVLTSAPLRVFDIPGNHFEPFRQYNIQRVSGQIEAGCQYLESLPLRSANSLLMKE
ncbi:hypothetical protein ONZ45_g671 [Pleurotus djamor]|nr:hypothetical protein ONZ45_g671 [Pleurotus djamor]